MNPSRVGRNLVIIFTKIGNLSLTVTQKELLGKYDWMIFIASFKWQIENSPLHQKWLWFITFQYIFKTTLYTQKNFSSKAITGLITNCIYQLLRSQLILKESQWKRCDGITFPNIWPSLSLSLSCKDQETFCVQFPKLKLGDHHRNCLTVRFKWLSQTRNASPTEIGIREAKLSEDI